MRTITIQVGNRTVDYDQEIEMTFQCPVCFSIETLFLEDGVLTRTPYWVPYRGRVYHRNCGRPARLINMSRRPLSLPSGTAVQLVRLLRNNRETIGEFAAKIGVSRITVKRWLLGKCHPNRTSRKRIAGYASTGHTGFGHPGNGSGGTRSRIALVR